MSGAEATAGAQKAADALFARPALLLTLTTFFWGGNTIAGQLSVGHIGPFTLLVLRGVLAAAILWPFYGGALRRCWPTIRPRLAVTALMSAIGLSGFNGLFYSASHMTTAVNIGIIQGALPGFVLVGAFLAHGARVGPAQCLGVLLTAIGVALIATRGAPWQLLSNAYNAGDLLMLAACLLYAAYTVWLRDRPKVPGAVFLLLVTITSSIAGLPFALVEAASADYQLPSLQGWMVALYVALFPFALAQIFYMRGVDLIGPGRAGAFINLVPIFAAGLAVALLGEPFRGFHALALALVLSGVWLAQRPAPAMRPTA